jgi:hypothetical protein
MVNIKITLSHVMPNLCFYIRWDLWATYRIPLCPSAKHQRAIFHTQEARCGFNIKRTGTHYAKFMLLNSVDSLGHIVHSSVFGQQNVDALFLMRASLLWIQPHLFVGVGVRLIFGHCRKEPTYNSCHGFIWIPIWVFYYSMERSSSIL